MTTLDKALDNPEIGIKPPTRRKSSSFTAQVIDLEVGESCSRVEQIDPRMAVLTVQQNIVTMRQQFRNRCDPSVMQAKKATGGQYVLEVTDVMTAARSWFILAIVTRTE